MLWLALATIIGASNAFAVLRSRFWSIARQHCEPPNLRGKANMPNMIYPETKYITPDRVKRWYADLKADEALEDWRSRHPGDESETFYDAQEQAGNVAWAEAYAEDIQVALDYLQDAGVATFSKHGLYR
jgi:hypothetical protein